VSDVHLGDWGLQMGMVINELQTRHPDWVYFDSSVSGPYPEESPLTIEDLESLYPEASQRAKAHESVMSEARRATVELQNGRPGYRALWQHFIHISVADVKQVYDRLGVDFDLWLGESDAHDVLVQQIDHLISSGWAHESDGALIIDVAEEGDTKEMPPLLLRNSDGAVLYGGTDLATIKQRVGTYHPDAIIVVADKRQSLHFQQVFRAALKVGYVSDVEKLEHVGFGTVNGPDNKPFKTRDGGTMKLDDFLSMVIANAKERIAEVQQGTKFSDEERESIAQMVGLATIKFADLVTHHTKDYVFDLERFSSFEGYTGPYVLYSAVRAKAILAKGESEGSVPGQAGAPQVDEERALAIKLLEYPDVLQASWKERTPSILCDYTYELANAFSSFYHACPILNDEDEGRRSGRLLLVSKVHDTLVASLYLLGMEVPERM
jgi:arginyl-tRNA synthetase